MARQRNNHHPHYTDNRSVDLVAWEEVVTIRSRCDVQATEEVLVEHSLPFAALLNMVR